MKRPGLLVVDDDDSIRLQLKWAFSPYYDVLEAGGRKEAIEAFRSERPAVAIIDLGLPPRPFESSEGLRTILEVLETSPSTKTIAVTGLMERENGLKAIDLGAYDFLQKPFDLDEMKSIVKRAFCIHGMQREIALKTPGASAGIPAKKAGATGRTLEVAPEALKLGCAPHRVAHPNSFHEAKEGFKRKLVLDTLVQNDWAISRSALELGISRQYLSRLMTRYGLRSIRNENKQFGE